MLEKPDLQNQLITARLRDEYGLQVAQLTFLPLGADVNTAVYRVVTDDETAYFLKLRKGDFDEITVTVPQFLKTQGIQAIIAPLETRTRQRWASLDAYQMILYPFVEGQNGYEKVLSDRQWLDFGAALKAIHTAQVPAALTRLIPRETYSPRWREMVKTFQAQIEETAFDDPTAVKLAAFMLARRGEINRLVARADGLGFALQARSLELVLCHSDIHAGNLLIGSNDALYIVDWDNPIFAPKERDLMLVGGCAVWNSTRQEALFYQGYGQTEIDAMALAYYRYERIIQDIADFCEQLFLTVAGGEDREQSYQYFTSIFLPNHEIEIAFKTDRLLREELAD
ncbi:MAG: aminoglycoside phosphotransferase family protein [Chloroflexi bacterium]|nr:aminoglycoside phosphotransferase family protein [Chloroflexota bacterium]